MKRLLHLLVVVPLLLGVVSAPVLAGNSLYVSRSSEDMDWDQDPPGELILADVLVLRPLGIAASAVGVVGTIISAPWAATSGSEDRVKRQLLWKPFDYTFCRPLGDVDY